MHKLPFAGGGGRMVRTASTTSAASCLESAAFTFVASEVCATFINVARSNLDGCLNVSKNYPSRAIS